MDEDFVTKIFFLFFQGNGGDNGQLPWRINNGLAVAMTTFSLLTDSIG